jgi:hypothetical protein
VDTYSWLTAGLFDHLVGVSEDRLQEIEAERLGGLEVQRKACPPG